MKGFIFGAAIALSLPVCAVEHDQTYQKTFGTGASQRKLIVENINGPVRVSGDSGNDVRVTVREHFRADTPEALARGRNEVKVEMTQERNTVRVCLDGPFRENRRGPRNGESYSFRHEFELQVPRDIDLVLRTVNSGNPGIQVNNVRGHFEVRNVNGGVEMTGIAGQGSAETVNGTLQVTFVQNPKQPSTFKTLNGTIDVAFQPDLSADLNLHIMHGEAWTDFDFTPLAVVAETQRGTSGFRYRISDRNRRLRVGSGGVEHSLKTMNGSIKIRRYGK
jgi:DUF4097 and DUF4098 domain-containing protein YvlB